MQEWLTVKQVHDAYPEVSKKFAQNVAREELADKGLAHKIGSERRGTWLISPKAIPNLRARAQNPARKKRVPTEDERVIVDKVYRLYGSVNSVAVHFYIGWARARAWLVEIYGPDTDEWPGYQYPIPETDS